MQIPLRLTSIQRLTACAWTSEAFWKALAAWWKVPTCLGGLQQPYMVSSQQRRSMLTPAWLRPWKNYFDDGQRCGGATQATQESHWDDTLITGDIDLESVPREVEERLRRGRVVQSDQWPIGTE